LHHTSDGSLANAFTIYDSWRLFAKLTEDAAKSLVDAFVTCRN